MINKQNSDQITEAQRQGFLAKLYRAVVGSDNDIYVVEQSLAIERTEKGALEINQPFRGFFIAKIYTTSTGVIDTTATANLKLQSNKSNDSIVVNHNMSYDSDAVYSRAYLWWSAQPDKTIKILFFKYGKIEGGIDTSSSIVSVTLPSSFPLSNPVLAAATALSLAAVNANRKRLTIQNNDAASIWLGPVTVTNAGATRGIEILSGGYIEILNTAAIYGYSVLGFAAGGLTVVEET